MYRVRRVLCVEVKQRQILPGLSEADYPQTGSRAHEKKAYSCYAVGAKKAFDCRAFRTQKQRGKGLIPLPLKSRFYCVTFQKLHLWENGRGGQHIGCRVRSFLLICSSAFLILQAGTAGVILSASLWCTGAYLRRIFRNPVRNMQSFSWLCASISSNFFSSTYW